MLGFKPKVTIDPALYAGVKQVAQAAGYATVDEFVTHLLEKAVADVQRAESEAEVRKRLQGLGYIE
ncbi:MAG: hypothetical protein HUU20_20350 [Pirellulales bacterium]|nr:hypothetical protein [Pirellulales bacterium]